MNLPPSDRFTRELAIALVSAAVILLQITLTRLLSVLLWYHWAFFAITTAMLGLGAPGVWLNFVAVRARERLLIPALLAAAVTVPGGVFALIHLSRPAGETPIVVYFLCLLPAALALGTGVCILLLGAEGRSIGRMYAADLAGAAAGAFVVIPLLGILPTPTLAASLGILPLTAAALLGARRAVVGSLSILLVATLVWGEPFRVRTTKAYVETGSAIPIWELWTPTARLTVFDRLFWAQSPDSPFGWGMGATLPDVPAVEQYWLEQDGSAGTPITRFDGDMTRLSYLFHDVTTVGYQLRPPRRVAIVGAGGGRDVLTARLAEAETIDAIELNAGIVKALRGPFREFSGGVYDLPGVRAVIGEGRSVLTGSQGEYDLVQISLIDSWAATAAGAFALSENNLYTKEAFRLYWSKLSPAGLLSVSRWTLGGFGMELPRLLFLADAALREEGIAGTHDHLAVFQGGAVATVLTSKTPFTAEEKARMLAIAEARGFALHLPVTNLPPEERWIADLARGGPGAFAGHGVNLNPPTDDRPFFFQVLSPFERVNPDLVARTGVSGEGIAALRRLMLLVGAATLVLFFCPFLWRSRVPRGRFFWSGSLYFAAIGIGFMLVEVAWVQRFILYLGHPSRAAAAGLGGIMLGAGLGSSLAKRLEPDRARRLGLAAPAFLLAMTFGLGPIFEMTLGWPVAARVAVTAVTIVPAGFVMGFFFPLGMVSFGEESRAWYWAMNGAAGVLASVISLALAMVMGFSWVAVLGCACYVVAWAVLAARVTRSRPGRARA